MEARAYIGWETTVARGRQAPVTRGRGAATGPLPPARDLFANSKKIYIRVLSPVAWATGPLSPLGRATGGIFEIFQNGHIFLNFFKYKKEKDADFWAVSVCVAKWAGSGDGRWTAEGFWAKRKIET